MRPQRRQATRLPHPWDSPGKNTGVGCHFLLQCMKVKSKSEVAQSSPTLRDPMDCSLPGSSIHGTFQARVLKWVAIAFSTWNDERRFKINSSLYLGLSHLIFNAQIHIAWTILRTKDRKLLDSRVTRNKSPSRKHSCNFSWGHFFPPAYCCSCPLCTVWGGSSIPVFQCEISHHETYLVSFLFPDYINC